MTNAFCHSPWCGVYSDMQHLVIIVWKWICIQRDLYFMHVEKSRGKKRRGHLESELQWEQMIRLKIFENFFFINASPAFGILKDSKCFINYKWKKHKNLCQNNIRNMLVPLSGTVKIVRWLVFWFLFFFLTLNGLHHGHKVASNQKLSECRQHYATPVYWMNAVLHKSGIKCVADLFMRSQTNVDCREARMPTHTHTHLVFDATPLWLCSR